MAKVDPFVIKWPSQWLSDPEIEPVIRYLNRFLHDLWIRSGGGTDLVEALTDISPSTEARIIAIEQRIGTGDALTSDETGFTVDSAILTVDMTEATV